MLTVHNKTAKPLRVPLPHGHVLHLAPAGDAAINDHAAVFPPLMKLATAGEIEVLDSASPHLEGPLGATPHASSGAKLHTKRTQPRGDR